MSNQVYSNENDLYHRVESAKFLIDKLTNTKIVMEGPPQVGDVLEVVALSNGTYEDPEVMRFKNIGEVVGDNLVTTKGGLLTNDGETAVELPVGVDRNILQANSAVAEGIEWTDNVRVTDLTVDNEIKVDNINSTTGSGSVKIEGVDLKAVGTTVDVHFGDVTAPQATNNASLHVEARTDTTILSDADTNDNLIGSAYDILQKSAGKFYTGRILDSATNDAIIETARISTQPANNYKIRVGGSYVSAPALGDKAQPLGGVDALIVDGANQNVEVTNKLIMNNVNGINIGDTNTTSNNPASICIGKNSQGSALRVTCLGQDTFSSGNNGTAIGEGAYIEANEGTAIGKSSYIAPGALRCCNLGRGTTSNHADSIVLGMNAVSNNVGDFSAGSVTAPLVIAPTATAGAQTLPTNPVGFWDIHINGTRYKIPLYNA